MAKPQNIEQRNLILKTSFELFLEKGYNNTTTREIAKSCGIERGLLHYYYNKKNDILYSIYSSYLNTLKDFINDEFKLELPEIKIALLTRLFFRSILNQKKYLGILQSILEDNQLTKYKIQLTSSIFEHFLSDDSYTKNKIVIATMSAIASESQLLLGLINGDISINESVIENQIIKIQFDYLDYSLTDIDNFSKKSNELINSLDLNLFYKYLKDSIVWL